MSAELTADPPEIRRGLTLLCQPGQVHELRALNTNKGTVSGYYDTMDPMVRDAAGSTDKIGAAGVYVTINPLRPELLARANNRPESYAKHTASDADVLRRRWLPLDFDPIRPAGIPATDEEHQLAVLTARDVRTRLKSDGWPVRFSLIVETGLTYFTVLTFQTTRPRVT
jgi:hypothetical protein